MPDYDEASPPVFDSKEAKMTAEEIVLSDDPKIIGDVVYNFRFKMIGSSQNFEVEITDVDVEDIKNPVYDDDGSPVVVMSESDKLMFTQRAYNYFWKKLVDKAEETAIDKVQWGSV